MAQPRLHGATPPVTLVEVAEVLGFDDPEPPHP